jgi:hypothetical protein
MLKSLLADLIEVFGRILVFGRLDSEVEFAVGLVCVVEAISLGNIPIEFLPHSQACFIGP